MKYIIIFLIFLNFELFSNGIAGKSVICTPTAVTSKSGTLTEKEIEKILSSGNSYHMYQFTDSHYNTSSNAIYKQRSGFYKLRLGSGSFTSIIKPNEIIIDTLKINRKNLEYSLEYKDLGYRLTGVCEVFNSEEQYYKGIKKLLKKLNKKLQDKYDAESQGNKI